MARIFKDYCTGGKLNCRYVIMRNVVASGNAMRQTSRDV